MDHEKALIDMWQIAKDLDSVSDDQLLLERKLLTEVFMYVTAAIHRANSLERAKRNGSANLQRI